MNLDLGGRARQKNLGTKITIRTVLVRYTSQKTAAYSSDTRGSTALIGGTGKHEPEQQHFTCRQVHAAKAAFMDTAFKVH